VVMKQIYFGILLYLLVFATLNMNKWFCNAAYLPAVSVLMAVCVCVCMHKFLSH
jgi:hypothetical protein